MCIRVTCVHLSVHSMTRVPHACTVRCLKVHVYFMHMFSMSVHVFCVAAQGNGKRVANKDWRLCPKMETDELR